jgi:hypothetical protein
LEGLAGVTEVGAAVTGLFHFALFAAIFSALIRLSSSSGLRAAITSGSGAGAGLGAGFLVDDVGIFTLDTGGTGAAGPGVLFHFALFAATFSARNRRSLASSVSSTTTTAAAAAKI